MVIKTDYNIGDIVYLVTDVDQMERMITRLTITHTSITYELSQGSNSSWHYDIEFTKERDILKATTN